MDLEIMAASLQLIHSFQAQCLIGKKTHSVISSAITTKVKQLVVGQFYLSLIACESIAPE